MEGQTLNEATVLGWREAVPQSVDLPRLQHFLPYSISANFGIWAEVMDALGGWSEAFDRPGGDDVEICWRAQLQSYELGFAPEAVMHYRYRTSLMAMARQHFGYGLAEPRLYRTFREDGMRRRSARTVGSTYKAIIVEIPRLITRPETRGIWIRRFSHLLGLAVGSIRNRVLYL